MHNVRLQSKLALFDVTNLVVEATIEADIYVASSLARAALNVPISEVDSFLCHFGFSQA